jgi:hypothetical protein
MSCVSTSGGDVSKCAAAATREPFRPRRRPHVAELQRPGAEEEDVVRLDVHVRVVACVHVRQPAEEGFHGRPHADP